MVHVNLPYIFDLVEAEREGDRGGHQGWIHGGACGQVQAERSDSDGGRPGVP